MPKTKRLEVKIDIKRNKSGELKILIEIGDKTWEKLKELFIKRKKKK